jgi:hypothetical protein
MSLMVSTHEVLKFPGLGRLRVTVDKGSGTNEFKQFYWSKALNWSQGVSMRVQEQKVAN